VKVTLSSQKMDGVEAHMDEAVLRQRLEEHSQGHLLKFWDHLNETERCQLTAELSSLDLAYVNRCYEACIGDLKRPNGNCDNHLEPLPESVVGSVVRSDPETLKRYECEGLMLFVSWVSVVHVSIKALLAIVILT